jgi:MFS family permease
MEGTVVATAMPTIVGQLGGLSIYSWVFSVYLLTSTTTVPIYGKLSDLYGRKLIFAISMLMFLAGSVLCGQANTMEQLVFFRAVQGLGAGGVLPLAFTIVGELFSLEQRARMQGVLSGVWGVSAVIGPLVGGFLVDQVSWHWVFLINLIPGIQIQNQRGCNLPGVFFKECKGVLHDTEMQGFISGQAFQKPGEICIFRKNVSGSGVDFMGGLFIFQQPLENILHELAPLEVLGRLTTNGNLLH